MNEWKNNNLISNDSINYIINNLKFPNYDEFNWDNPNSNKYQGGCLVHNTYWKNVPNILEQGFRIDLNQYYSNDFTWAVNLAAFNTDLTEAWTGAGGTSIIFKPINNPVYKLNDTDFAIYDNVSPSAILSIDFPFLEEGRPIRVSQAYNWCLEYGVDKVKEVYNSDFKCSYISESDYNKIFDWIEYQI